MDKNGWICHIQHSFECFKISSFNHFPREAIPAIYCSVWESVIQRIILENLLLYLQFVATGFVVLLADFGKTSNSSGLLIRWWSDSITWGRISICVVQVNLVQAVLVSPCNQCHSLRGVSAWNIAEGSRFLRCLSSEKETTVVYNIPEVALRTWWTLAWVDRYFLI